MIQMEMPNPSLNLEQANMTLHDAMGGVAGSAAASAGKHGGRPKSSRY